MKKQYFLVLAFLFSWSLFASGTELHDDPIAPVLLGLFAIFIFAKLGASLAIKLGQPVVLGELLAGVLIGNLPLLGVGFLSTVAVEPLYSILASLGVILLLFEVGLESSLKELLKVGSTALIVALVGVIVPSCLGIVISHLLLPDASFYTHLFIGTTLCATSVGITARVLQDLHRTQSKEAKIILGAAVIDDVLGLIVLAVVSGLIAGVQSDSSGNFSLSEVGLVTGKALGFLLVSLVFGAKFAPNLFKLFSKLKVEGGLLTVSLLFCFALSYLSHWVGLAPIVGAFAAGLIIDSSGFSSYFPHEKKSIEEWIHPLSKFFVPIFFVHTGAQVKLESFLDINVLGFGIFLSLVGILGKLACSLAVRGESMNRLAIGIGMMPRGEVGLIFAMIGSRLILNGEPVISSKLYSSIIIMVMITTLVTPPALKWALERK